MLRTRSAPANSVNQCQRSTGGWETRLPGVPDQDKSESKSYRIGRLIRRYLDLFLAIFAMAWAILRARVQAMTIDESSSGVNFILPAVPTYFTAHANNHVLHSMLARIFVAFFGPSQFTVRGAALVGAALFIFASYAISRLITKDLLLRTALFLCLVFNPFIFDFLVAARGYGLASGFLLCGITWVAYAKRQGPGLFARI